MADDPQKTGPKEERRLMERREFLRKCGKYAVIVPPAMTLLLTRSHSAQALHPDITPPGHPFPPGLGKTFGHSVAGPFGGTPPPFPGGPTPPGLT